MPEADVVELPANGAGPEADNEALLDELRRLHGVITTAEQVVSQLYGQRMAVYLALRGRNVPFADIDKAAGNQAGAARAAIAKHRARLRKAQQTT